MSEKATVKIRLYVDKKDIMYLNSIIDSYEGVGIVRTINRHKGQVVIYTTKSQKDVLISILEALRKEGVTLEIVGVIENEEIDSWN
ncbi:MAG: DUF4911 domain-containing protein [Deferribacterota bacterium]|nr:DUF4911 domain-containing protein [Deferribacterota bacterium]